jgi:site-specific DNA-methyltransferase (adenine-specific)
MLKLVHKHAPELRFGRWQEALADIDLCDAVITDPPYSERTVRGQRSNRTKKWMGGPLSMIKYKWVSQIDIWDLVSYWIPRTRRWFVMFGDHITVRWALEALDARDWYTFPPVPWTKPDAAPRICGDGPSPKSEQICIARPKRRMFKPELRYRGGFYHLPSRGGRVKGLVGAKPVALLEQVIADYSEPGDLIVDPYAGGASTLLAALSTGRRAIGAEVSKKTYAKATTRLAAAIEAAA